MDLPEGYVSAQEVARQLGINVITIGRWELAGLVAEPRRLVRNNQRIYDRADIERLRTFMHERREAMKAAPKPEVKLIING